GAGARSPSRTAPGGRRCPRGTAGGSTALRSPTRATSPPRSSRLPPRPPRAAAGRARTRGTPRWPGGGRRGSAARAAPRRPRPVTAAARSGRDPGSLLERPPRQDPRQVALVVGRRVEVARRVGALGGLLGG